MLLLVLLFPLAVYLLVVASLNRRDRPVMISGVWDGIGLSFGLSGVLLWVGPAILGTIYERGLVPGANAGPRRFDEIWTVYPLVWIAYYAFVVAGQGMMIYGRRNKTAVYNADGDALERLMLDCLRERGYDTADSGGLVFFETESGEASESGHRRVPTGAIELEPFAPFRHVTLHWFVKDERIRRELESDLARRLPEALPADNPTATWLLGISGFLFGCVFLGSLYIILLSLYAGR